MRKSLLAVSLFTVLCTLPMTGESAAPSGFRITGVVVNSLNKAPVAYAHLDASPAITERRMNSTFNPRTGIATDTDDQGRFALTLPSAGAWRLTASASGFVTQAYEEHDNYSSAVVLSAANPSTRLQFSLPPEAEITGTVIDEAGEPVRDARVTLQHRASTSPDRKEQPFQARMSVQTDDRGIYEFAGLAPGDYRVLVNARPWYSMASQSRRYNDTSNEAPPDPSLDVTYQVTWFPGVDDPAQAEVFSLKPADSRTADFHLVPIPAIHLQLELPQSSSTINGRPAPTFPVFERIDNGAGGQGMVQAMPGGRISQGKMDIGGLAPGLYRVRFPGPDRTSQSEIVEIAAGATRTVDLASAATGVANITVNLDSDEDHSFGVVLRSLESGRRFSSFEGSLRRGSSEQSSQSVTLQVPPGRYEVFVAGRGNSFLTGITAKGAEVKGRQITVGTGDIVLALHTSNGYASVSGVATTGDGKPVVGAMVLLVPAGLDDPASFAVLVRDQSNTDGSFHLNNVIPGPYILAAIDHGWDVNWKDPMTLQRYLTQGIPLDLRANMNLKQDIPTQSP
ncbi:carboxypeptidase-like regulatory domain-containing protein [Edaphobacter albus]|uniref:carboxypeptidase-like regulatory domain-containing protein n=1 Tax=Edaphobacter sp. 4G125 TaxID=2763071 RepID=UPI0016466EDB|nr:carboxypeptidase-like regulatory domain-containing protein [Edaphobacter sp. 4G125]QNI35463.1 carboxypeptidase regulatory-like domain-containing protein [Edaphobacter sp. 4G125]